MAQTHLILYFYYFCVENKLVQTPPPTFFERCPYNVNVKIEELYTSSIRLLTLMLSVQGATGVSAVIRWHIGDTDTVTPDPSSGGDSNH